MSKVRRGSESESPLSSRQKLGAFLWALADMERAVSTRRSFRARAYREAVWSLDDLSPQVDEPVEALRDVAGIGPGISSLIVEFRMTGGIRRLDELLRLYPRESNQLRRLPRMSPATLRRLKELNGVDTVDDLLRGIEEHQIEMAGVGDKTLALWASRLSEWPQNAAPIYDAAMLARRFARHIDGHTGSRTEVTGSIRRFDEMVSTIDLLVIGGRDLDDFLGGSALVQGSHPQGQTLFLETLAGAVAAHLGSPESAGTEHILTTGPSEHIEALIGVSDRGEVPFGATEAEVYRGLGLELVPAPARGTDLSPGPVAMPADLIGDLHLHTDESPDGRQSLLEVTREATKRRLRYIAITDHAANLRFGGLDIDSLRRQADAIEMVRQDFPDLLILHGAELNIDRDGALDYPDDVLEVLDFRLASVHANFDLERRAQTSRLLKVVEHPLVHAIAHPTGRRIGRRPAIDFDMGVLIEAAAHNRVALEVNGHLDRLDLSAHHASMATLRHGLLVANSDAHRPGEMDNVENAIGVLQRARVQSDSIVNTWQPAAFRRWVLSKSFI